MGRIDKLPHAIMPRPAPRFAIATDHNTDVARVEPTMPIELIDGRAEATGGAVADFIRATEPAELRGPEGERLPPLDLAATDPKPATAGELAAAAIKQTCEVTAERVLAAAADVVAAALAMQRDAEEFAAELRNLGGAQAERISLLSGLLLGTSEAMKAERARVAGLGGEQTQGYQG